MKPKKLIINTSSQKYPIFIGSNLVSKTRYIFNKNLIKFEKCLLVADKNVPKKFILSIKNALKDKSIFLHFIKADEKNKNQKSVNKILQILLSKNFSRQDCLISIGGGITGDVAGFASSLFKRGLQFINIPTTLLSQVDSSIGGKTGINTSFGKNLIGSFYQPKLVISDSIFLKSLPKREIICGYGEVLKHALISNKKNFLFLDKNITNILNLKSPFIEKAIYESCKIKKIVVEKDEKENNLRKILNFGHTFAHAYEASLNYSKKLNHGEAVMLGMKSAIDLSYRIKLLRLKEYNMIFKHFKKSNLPSNLNSYFSQKNINTISTFMTKDKKNNSNKINLILLKQIGTPLKDKKFTQDYLRLFLKNTLNN